MYVSHIKVHKRKSIETKYGEVQQQTLMNESMKHSTTSGCRNST